MMDQEKITVLYITGWCRNGSTLIGNILNEMEGFLHVGELYYLWKNAFGRGTNRLCGCGKSLLDCELWSQVIADVQRANPLPLGQEYWLHMQNAVRTRHTWRVLNSHFQKDARLQTYARLLSLLYKSIHKRSRARVIVDSGKYPAEASLLPFVQGVNPLYLHLVRDPRASALSWRTPKQYIPGMSAFRSTWYWVGFNLASDALRNKFPERSYLLRYEDFVSAPRQTLTRMLEHFQIHGGQIPVQDHSVNLGINHTVTGNPDRFIKGDVPIRARDDQWKVQLPARDLWTVNTLSWPLQRRYGYKPQA